MKSHMKIRPTQWGSGISEELDKLLCTITGSRSPLRPVFTDEDRRQVAQLEAESEDHPEDTALALEIRDTYHSFDQRDLMLEWVNTWRVIAAYILNDNYDAAIAEMDAFERQHMSGRSCRSFGTDYAFIKEHLASEEAKFIAYASSECANPSHPDVCKLRGIAELYGRVQNRKAQIQRLRSAVQVALASASAAADDYAAGSRGQFQDPVAQLELRDRFELEIGDNAMIEQVITRNKSRVLELLRVNPALMPAEILPTCATIVPIDSAVIDAYEKAIMSEAPAIHELTFLRDAYRSFSDGRQFYCSARLARGLLLIKEKAAAVREIAGSVDVCLCITCLYENDSFYGSGERTVARSERVLLSDPNSLLALKTIKHNCGRLGHVAKSRGAAFKESIICLQHAIAAAGEIAAIRT